MHAGIGDPVPTADQGNDIELGQLVKNRRAYTDSQAQQNSSDICEGDDCLVPLVRTDH